MSAFRGNLVERGLFVAAIDSKQGSHKTLSASESERATLPMALKSLIASFPTGSRLEFKLVGCRALVSAAEDILSQNRQRRIRSAYREGNCEILFDSEAGRLRVSKEKTRVLIADDSD